MSRIFTRDFYVEVQRGKVPRHSIINKFGFNSDIDTGSVSEDIWNGGGLYTGFNATAAETLEVFGGSADVGTVISSGTVDGGDELTLNDTSADFIADGVSATVPYDLLVNDTQGVHSIITARTGTSLTLNHLTHTSDIETVYSMEAGDEYRVVTSAGTGAAVVALPKLLNTDYERRFEYVVLNNLFY